MTALLNAELALKHAYSLHDSRADGMKLLDAAVQHWMSVRFPPVKDWQPAPGAFVRWNSSHPNRGKIERVVSVIESMNTFFIELPHVAVSSTFLEPWVPWIGETITFRDGHPLAGYSYEVSELHQPTHVQLSGFTSATRLTDVMPCTNPSEARPGPGASGDRRR